MTGFFIFFALQGSITSIEVSASTYDNLIAKKPLCEGITKSCVAVADKVWDTFLKDVAPQLKNAELIAEDKARQDCVGNISNCFQKACKDNMDPNDPDGSYDLCLTRPETMLNLCKIPLNACGIDASSKQSAEQSDVWDFVVARLASMRVDACTAEVKSCLQADDRCGKDYTKCIGLDIDALKEMCPLEKLLACQTSDDNGNYSAKWTQFENIVQGVWLGIDNSLLEQCKQIVNERMLELCGDTATCMAFDDDKAIGTESLVSYQENNGNYVIEGLISFGNIKIERATSSDDDIKFGKYEININDYKRHLDSTNPTTARVVSALQSTASKINQKISVLSQDPQVDMCINGRNMRNINGRESTAAARFPYLLDSYILAIISSGLDRAHKNYTEKYNKLLGEALEAKDDAIKATLCAAMASNEKPQCTEWISVDGNAFCTQYTANTFDNVFSDEGTKGLSGNDIYSTKYTITGAKLSDLAALQQKGHAEFTQTDSKGNMIGKIATAAVYSPGNNTCTLTTTTTMCSDMEAIITTDTTKTCKSGGFSFLGGSGCKGGGGFWNIGGSSNTTTVDQTYEGLNCNGFMDPITTTSSIKM